MFCSHVTVHAEDKAAFDPSKAESAGLGLPTPYDKFLAIDMALPKGKVKWAKAYVDVSRNVDPDKFSDKQVGIPMALGVRIADGVMAVKAKDAEMVKQCADDIEKLAKKMGIADGELKRARDVRDASQRGEWLKVFMDLAFLQQDIMNLISKKKDASETVLLIVAGWMQGARYTGRVISENYTPELSNILREPKLAEALLDAVKKLPPEVQKHPQVVRVSDSLPKVYQILNVGLNDPITKEKIAELEGIATAIVNAAVIK
jgi:hypothetical protein